VTGPGDFAGDYRRGGLGDVVAVLAIAAPAVRGKLLALPGVVGLHDAFEITHVTLQIEPQTFAAQCALAASAAACPGRVTSEQLR